MAIKIYTKTGDKGKTSLLGGTKIFKSDMRIESYGSVDELNSFIGLLCASVSDNNVVSELRGIQSALFTIGSHLACDTKKFPIEKLPFISDEAITGLEMSIDKMNESLPEMKNFILPGGGNGAATAHVCRSVCRRAERHIVALIESGNEVEEIIVRYLNRLSDYFFVLARYLSFQLGEEEIIWKG